MSAVPALDPRSEALLARMIALVNHPLASAPERAESLRTAYDLGRADGRYEGMQRMGEQLMDTMRPRTPISHTDVDPPL